MSSRPYPLTPSPSNLSFTLTSTHTHYQHISPHRHLPHCVQAGSGNPTAQKPTLNTSLIEHYRPVSLLPFIAKTLERVVFNQVSLFLSQNNKLDAKQSGFRSGHSTKTALLSVTEALRIAKADSKSSVLILLDLSAAFDTVNHHILLSTLSSLDITGIPLRWFESYLTGRSFKVAWGGEVSKAHQLVTTSLGPVIQAHGFSNHFYTDDTQLYLSFRPDDPTVAARISGSSRHGWKNITYSSTWQRLSFLSSLPLQLYSMTSRFINNYPINFGQKSWCNLWWSADLQRAHCKDCSILQVCSTQHQKDQALSDRACCTTSCPGPCHF